MSESHYESAQGTVKAAAHALALASCRAYRARAALDAARAALDAAYAAFDAANAAAVAADADAERRRP